MSTRTMELTQKQMKRLWNNPDARLFDLSCLRAGAVMLLSGASLYPLVDYNCFARRRNPFAYPGPGTGTP
ncbi:hypothetical protein F220043C3_26820 [Enterocloster asparagiformis]